jgi:predicted AlkP superfamily pyrophosphatase or phosphodiesterase
MIKEGILAFLISLVFFNAFGQHAGKQEPKLVVGITVEHMRSDYISRYWDTFQNDGFKRLVNGGAVFSNARADIHNIKPSTVLATLYSGAYPSIHGIIADKWLNPVTNNEVNSVFDDYYLTLGSDSDFGSVSARQLKVFNLADELKLQSNLKSKVFSVALNPEAAVMSAGHSADGAFWYDYSNGNMISSSYYMDQFPDWVVDFNAKKMPETYLQREWDLLLPLSSYKASFEDAHVLEAGFWKRWNTFPYNLSRIARDQEYPLEIIKATYFGNKLVRDFAVQLFSNERLGRGQHADMLNITFSSLDYANKWFHPSSVEMQEVYLRIDREIASLLNYFDGVMGKDNYLVFLTSASTSVYPVNVLKDDLNFNAGEFNPQSALALLRSYLNVTYGVDEWIHSYNEEQVYLNRSLIEQKRISLSEIRENAALFLNQFSGIKSAVPANIIETGNLNNPRFIAVENSYSAQRSGDIILLLDEGWYPVYRYHQVDYSNQNRVPLIFYGMNVRPGKIDENVNIIDVVPTLSKFLGIVPPDNASGRVLDKIFW